ncbi:MAG: hypothetical protein KAY24_10245 [Candidatus Eisenbacteria sp.]|nr:hypothetical protein [Candidatus Eisenbacteria bacterium]
MLRWLFTLAAVCLFIVGPTVVNYHDATPNRRNPGLVQTARADGDKLDVPDTGCLVRTVEARGYRVQLDLSTQVLSFEIPKDRGPLLWEGDITSTPREKAVEAPIRPTLSDMRSGILSASILAQKAKQFDDGLYAAVELAAQNGAGDFVGKAHLLRMVANAIASGEIDTAGAVVLAAAQLGGIEVPLSGTARAAVRLCESGFLDNELKSKPIGFYTWSGELTAIFRQDRMLQTELKGRTGIANVVRALHADQRSRSIYEAYLNLISRLTNPFPPEYAALDVQLAGLDRGLTMAPDDSVYFFPPSQAHETELAKRLFNEVQIPSGFNLADELIKRIRSGDISLEPTESSGWYDYLTWALEPFVVPERMPEAEHLRLEPGYRQQLVELFKGILTLTRETHIKQLEIPSIGGSRRPPTVNIYVAVSRELGMEPDLSATGDMARKAETYVTAFQGWAKDLASDPDIGTDARCMVPLFNDEWRDSTKVWVFLGWSEKPVMISFAESPVATIVDQEGNRVPDDVVTLDFQSVTRYLAYPVTAEIYVSKILDREEFRRICDEEQTQSKILAALE